MREFLKRKWYLHLGTQKYGSSLQFSQTDPAPQGRREELAEASLGARAKSHMKPPNRTKAKQKTETKSKRKKKEKEEGRRRKEKHRRKESMRPAWTQRAAL